MEEPFIVVEALCKQFKVAMRTAGLRQAVKALFVREYRKVEALRDISFRIRKGEIVGYIGPNGAGKSTTIKVMSGILVPDSGMCRVMGYVPWKDRTAYVRNIGVVFGQRTQLWWDVPVVDSFSLLKDIYNIPDRTFKDNVTLLLDTLQLHEMIHIPVRQLSLGQRMRCEFAASLLHDPAVVFLDEPTIGLDAESKLALREFVRTINREKGVTVILTTHDMGDIEALASRIMMIGQGSLLYDGTLSDLRRRFGDQRILTVDYRGSARDLTFPGAVLASHADGRVIFHIDSDEAGVAGIITGLAEQVEITDVSMDTQPIDEVILQLYKEHAI